MNNFISFEGSKTIIIGDMLELGDESEKEHQNILKLARDLHFNEIITVGKHFKAGPICSVSCNCPLVLL